MGGSGKGMRLRRCDLSIRCTHQLCQHRPRPQGSRDCTRNLIRACCLLLPCYRWTYTVGSPAQSRRSRTADTCRGRMRRCFLRCTCRTASWDEECEYTRRMRNETALPDGPPMVIAMRACSCNPVTHTRSQLGSSVRHRSPSDHALVALSSLSPPY